MGNVNTYSVDGEIYEIPDDKKELFIKEKPNAVPVYTFDNEGEQYDIPKDKVNDFKKSFPNAKPKYEYADLTTSIPKTGPTAQQNQLPQEKEGGFWNEMGARATKGAAELGSMLAKTPGFIYDVAAIPQNIIADKLNIPSLATSSKKVSEALGIENSVAEYYDKGSDYYAQKIADNNPKYQQGIVESIGNGDWGTAGRNLLGGILESSAPSIAMMATGGLGTPTMIGTGAAVFGAGKKAELDENAPQMSDADRTMIALSNGALEGLFETALGAGAMGSALKNIVAKSLSEGGEQLAKQNTKAFVNDAFVKMIEKNPELGMLGEGLEEVGTQFSQNAVDKYSGYRPDINLADGAADAFLMGIGMGAGMAAPLKVVKAISEKKTAENNIKSNISEIINSQTGNIHVLLKKNDAGEDETFFELGRTEGGMVVVTDRTRDEKGNLNTRTMGETEFSDPIQLDPNKQFQNELNNYLQQKQQTDQLNQAVEEEVKSQQKEIESIPTQITIPNEKGEQKVYRFDPSEQNVRRDPNTGEIVDFLMEEQGIDGTPEGIASVPASTVYDFMKKQRAEQEKVQLEQKKEAERTLQEEQAQAPKVEPISERPIITQKFGNTAIDILEGDQFDEIIPSDKLPLEKALPILEEKFKDNPKFELQVEKSQIELPGETKYDDPIKQTVIKSIKIVPKQSKATPPVESVEQPTEISTPVVDLSTPATETITQPEEITGTQEVVPVQEVNPPVNLSQSTPENEVGGTSNENVKGITSVNEEDDGETLVYGSKNNQTRLSIQGLSVDDIKDEIDFAKQSALKSQKLIDDYENTTHIIDENTNKEIEGLNLSKKHIEASKVVIPWLEKKLIEKQSKEPLVEANPAVPSEDLSKLSWDELTDRYVNSTSNEETKALSEEIKKRKKQLTIVDQAASETNINPTEAQKKAGNYKKGHVTVQGMDISIENPKGSIRSGTDEDGKAWETKMNSHYGYFKQTTGKDGDHIDTFIGDNPESQKVFVVDQINPKTGNFDESKVMLGFDNAQQAHDAYLSNYEPGWKGLGSITEVEVEPFKKWLYDDQRQLKPFSEYKGHEELLKYTEPIQKEPWQMTREEYAIWNDKRLTQNTIDKYKKEINDLKTTKILPHQKGELENKLKPLEKRLKRLEEDLSNRTDQEWLDLSNIENYPNINDKTHIPLIQQAISEGKPVPPEVLADYPELQKNNNIETLQNENVSQLPSETPVNTDGVTENGVTNLQEVNTNKEQKLPETEDYIPEIPYQEDKTFFENLEQAVSPKTDKNGKIEAERQGNKRRQRLLTQPTEQTIPGEAAGNTAENIKTELKKEKKDNSDAIFKVQKKQLLDDLRSVEDILLGSEVDNAHKLESERNSIKEDKNKTDILIEGLYQKESTDLTKEELKSLEEKGVTIDENGNISIDVYRDGTVKVGNIRTAIRTIEKNFPEGLPTHNYFTPLPNRKPGEQAGQLNNLKEAEDKLEFARKNLAEAEKSGLKGMIATMQKQFDQANEVYQYAKGLDFEASNRLKEIQKDTEFYNLVTAYDFGMDKWELFQLVNKYRPEKLTIQSINELIEAKKISDQGLTFGDYLDNLYSDLSKRENAFYNTKYGKSNRERQKQYENQHRLKNERTKLDELQKSKYRLGLLVDKINADKKPITEIKKTEEQPITNLSSTEYEKISDTYYYLLNIKGVRTFNKTKGKPIDLGIGGDYFIHNNDGNGTNLSKVIISEGRTGLAVGSGETEAMAIRQAKDNLEKYKATLEKTIQDNLDKYGYSPRYGKKTEVPEVKPIINEPKKLDEEDKKQLILDSVNRITDSRISDYIKNRKEDNREPYTDEQLKELKVNVFNGHLNGFNKLAASIDNKDYKSLVDKLHLGNKFWRKFFEDYTGIKLGKTLKETHETLKNYTGYVEPQVETMPKLSKEESLSRMQKANNEKILSQKLNYGSDFGILTRKQFIEELVKRGRKFEVDQENKIKDITRSAYNRMDDRQQREFERRRKEAGLKNIYKAVDEKGSYYEITKAEYDYANTLSEKENNTKSDTNTIYDKTLNEYVGEQMIGITEGGYSDPEAEFFNEYYTELENHIKQGGQISKRVYETLDNLFKNTRIPKYVSSTNKVVVDNNTPQTNSAILPQKGDKIKFNLGGREYILPYEEYKLQPSGNVTFDLFGMKTLPRDQYEIVPEVKPEVKYGAEKNPIKLRTIGEKGATNPDMAENSPIRSEVSEGAFFDILKSNVIKNELMKLFSKGVNTGTVHVVESINDIPSRYKSQIKGGKTYGFFDPNTGESYFITGNITSIEEAVKTWIHEVGGHKGLSNIIPSDYFNPLMEKLVDDIGMEEIKKILPENYWNQDKATIGEEYLVHLGQKILNVKDLTPKEKSIWKKMLDSIRDILNRIFDFKKKFTTKDAENLIRAAVQSVYQMPEPNLKDYYNILDYNEAMVNYEKSKEGKQPLPETININGVERPTTNSKGQPIADSEEKIRNFYKWFGDSKVVDEEGRPMVVYHGTRGDFDVFGKGVEASPLSHKDRLWYFTNDLKTANIFAGGSKKAFENIGSTGSVLPVYLSVKNPNILNHKEQDSQDAIEDVGYWATNEQLDNFQNRGFDGIMLDDFSQIIAMSPTQIKSATGNLGTFSESNPDIRFRNDRSGNAIGDGTYHEPVNVYDFKEYPQVGSRINESNTTETSYVTYFNKDNGKSIQVRFSGHENNAVKFGDQLDGNFATENEILFHLGLKKREFVPNKFLFIGTRQVAKKDLSNYEEADKTIKELYSLGANADISEYVGKLAKGSNYLILDNTISEEFETKKGFLGDTVKVGKFVYSDIDNQIKFRNEEPTMKSELDKAVETIDKKPSKFEVGKIIDGIRKAAQDRDLPIRRLIETIVKRGGVKKNDADAYRDITLAHGRAETLLKNFEKNKMQKVIDAVSEMKKNDGIDQNRITLYTIAKHAPERNELIRSQKLNEWINENPIPDDATKLTEWEDKRNKQQEYLSTRDFSGILSRDTEGNYDNRPDEYANTLIDDFESIVPKDQIKNYWKSVNDVNKFTLDRWLDGNQISKEYYDQMVSGYKYYVPLKGWWDDAAKELDYHSGIGSGKSLHTAEGRTSLPDDPLAYMEQQAFKSISEQVDNEVKLSMLRFVMDNMKGNEDLLNLKKVYYVQNPLTQEWDYTLEKPSAEQFADGTAKTIQYKDHMRLRKPMNAKEHEVWVETKYGTYAMVFPDEQLEVAQSLNHQNNLIGGMDAEVFNKFMGKSLGWFTNIQKSLYTSWNIVFPIKNILRDMPEAGSHILIKYGAKQAKDFTKSLPIAGAASGRLLYGNPKPQRDINGNALNIDAKMEDFALAGGMTGFTHLKTPEEYQKEIARRVKRASSKRWHLREALENFSELFEDTTRFAAYLSGINNGMTIKDAALLAKEVSVNFNRKGKLSKAFDSTYAFFNAAMQAGQKNLSLAKNQPKAFWSVAAGWTIAGIIVAEINRLLGGGDDDDDYERLNKFVRMNYLVFPIGGGEYLRVPLPPFFRGFYAMGSNISDVIHGKSEPLQATGDGLLNFANALTPIDISNFFDKDSKWYSSIVPTAFKPISEIAQNKDFMNYPIYKEAFTKELEGVLANSQMHKNNVNLAYKFITDAMFELGGGNSKYNFYYDPATGDNKPVPVMMDWNPSKIEYFVKAYSGGTGAFVNDLVNTLMNASNGIFDTDKIPYINSFIRKYPEKKWTVIGEYYKMKENDDKWQKSSKEYKKQGDTEIFYDMSHNTEKNNRHSDIKAADKKIDNLKEKFDNGEIDLDEYLEMKANIAEQIINKYQ